MNFTKWLLFVLLLMSFVTAHSDEDDHSADREQLKQILSSIEESLNTLQLDKLLSHFDDQAVLSFMTTEVANGKDGILDYYDKMFNLPDSPLKSYHTKATLDGHAQFHGDTSVASGRTQDSFELADGRQYQFNTRWLATAVKKQGQWKVVALDFSVDPFDNVILDEIGLQMFNYALLAFFAGLAIMFVITRLLHKKDKGTRV